MAYSQKLRALGLALLGIIKRFLRDPKRKLRYTNHLIMLNLHMGDFNKARILEFEIQSQPELKARQLYTLGDFQPAEVNYSSDFLKIQIDSRISELSSYLISGIEKAEQWISSQFPGFKSVLNYFLMNDTGPSPFNAQLGDVYLKVGHYNPVSNDREILQHAIVHELTHILLRNHIGFKIRQSEFGIRKFFDEGFAQYCGFQSVGAYSRKLAHADTCSTVVIKRNLYGLLHRIENWNETIFNERHYPLYQASMSFVGYFQEQIGFDGLVDLFRNSGYDTNFPKLIEDKTGASFENHLSNWATQLPSLAEQTDQEFCEIASVERLSPNKLKISYYSKFPLYPIKDILALDSSGTQLEIQVDRRKRYEQSGEFMLLCEEGETLYLTIIHDDKVQQIKV